MLSKKTFVSTFTLLALGLLSACATPPAQERSAIESRLQALQADLKAINGRLDDVEDRLQQDPQMARFEVELGDAPRLGSGSAKVAIVEFSDYQCPFCKKFHMQVLPQLQQSYIDKGEVVFVFKDLPLEFHADAKSAAVAANCAGEQGHYWDYQAALFQNQQKIGHDFYLELVQQQGLDKTTFEQCLADPAQLKAVEKDLAYGGALGIDGTPSFFVGRIDADNKVVDAVRIVGAQPLPVFSQTIDRLLKKTN